MRDKDLADLVGLLVNRADDLRPGQVWQRAAAAGLERYVRDRLNELAELFRGGEAMSAWYIVTGEILSDAQQQVALAAIRRLLKHRT